MLTSKIFEEIGHFFAKQLCIFTFCVLKSLQVVFGFPAPPSTAARHTTSHGTDRCELVLYPPRCAISLPRSPPGYLGGTSGTAIQIQLSPRRELRRSEADILRIISAKFCSPVRKFLMERVNGQSGNLLVRVFRLKPWQSGLF